MNNNFDVNNIKKDFPILTRKINGKNLVYLDSAASTQKPKSVIDSITNTYSYSYANIHRGAYTLSIEATENYEATRTKIAKFINAQEREVIFTKGATESINLIVSSFGYNNINSGDRILLSEFEHHSNLVPWQVLTKEKNAELVFVKTDENLLENFEKECKKGAKIASFTHMSNVLGTILPIEEMIKIARKYNIIFIVDASQSVPHLKIDLKKMDPDFLVFSGHKMLAPSGIGILYGKSEHLEKMTPYQYGGDMILDVSWQESTWNEIPWKFEAGTPPIANVIAFGAAIDYLEKIGIENIANHEKSLREYTLEKLSDFPELVIYTGAKNLPHGGNISFNLKDIHAHDIASILDNDGICIRSGHHCAKTLMLKLGVESTARLSFYLYNTKDDIDQFVNSLKKAYNIFYPYGK